MQVSSGGSEPSELRFVVVEAPPPSLDPIRIADMRAGETAASTWPATSARA